MKVSSQSTVSALLPHTRIYMDSVVSLEVKLCVCLFIKLSCNQRNSQDILTLKRDQLEENKHTMTIITYILFMQLEISYLY